MECPDGWRRNAAVLGTTGSGKSYTLAALAQAVLRSYARPRLVIFDIHNEYGPAFLGEFAHRSPHSEYPDQTEARIEV